MSHDTLIEKVEYEVRTNFERETEYFEEHQRDEAIKRGRETNAKVVEVYYWGRTEKTLLDMKDGANLIPDHELEGDEND